MKIMQKIKVHGRACQHCDIDIYIYITAIYLKTGVPENPLPDGP